MTVPGWLIGLCALLLAAPASAVPAGCSVGPQAAAAANAESLTQMLWHPFGRGETGWQIYAPKIATEIGSACPPETPGFALALSRWQTRHRRVASGVFDAVLFQAMKSGWQAARPFARINGKLSCPLPPSPDRLATVASGEGYGGKPVQMRRGVLDAWRLMRLAARRDVPPIAADPRSLQPYSGFRDPASDAQRCLLEQNCNGIVRATCSPHRTGLALDMWVGQAVGYGPDSTADVNRLAMVRSPQYRWLLANAGRFGFVNYVFEPWHWEWTGEPVVP